MDEANTDRSLPAEEPMLDSELADMEDDPVRVAGPIPRVYSATFSAATWADVPPATRALLLSTVAETRRSFRDEDASDLAREQALAVEESAAMAAAMAAAIAKEASDLQAAEDAVRARNDLRRRLGSAERAVIATAARAATSRAAVLAEQRRAYDLEAAHASPRGPPGSPRSSSAETSLGRPARLSLSSACPPPVTAAVTAAPEIASPPYEAAPAASSRAAHVAEQRLGSGVKAAAHAKPRSQPGCSPRSSPTTNKSLVWSARPSPPSARPPPSSTVASATVATVKPETTTPPTYRYHELGVDRAFLEVPMRDFVRYRQLAFKQDHAAAVSAAAASLLAMMEDFPTATLSFVIRKSRPPLPSATVTAVAHELLLALRAAYKCSISTPKWPRHQVTPRAAGPRAGGDTSNRAMHPKNQRGKRSAEVQGRRNNGRNQSSSSSNQHARRDAYRRGRGGGGGGGEPSSRSLSSSRPNKSRRQDGNADGRSAPAGRAMSGTRSQARESNGPRQLKGASGQNEPSPDVQVRKAPKQVVASLEDASSTTAAAVTSWSTDIWAPAASGARASWCANNTPPQSPTSDA